MSAVELPSRPDLSERTTAIEAVYAAGHWLLSCDRVPEAAAAFRLMLRAAPRDERAWIGLGHCHERMAQPLIALELYRAGSIAAAEGGVASVRCLVAHARIVASLGRDPSMLLDLAEQAARRRSSEELVGLVDRERERPS